MRSAAQENITNEAIQRLREALQEVPFVKVLDIQLVQNSQGPDIIANVSTPDGLRRLMVEIKTGVSPHSLRWLAQELKSRFANLPDAVPVLIAPYLSERSQEVCRQFGISCLDLAGNVRLTFDQIFIERSGKPSPVPLRRLQRSLFSRRTTRMLRVLLENPSRRWYVQDLAKEAGISLGQVSNTKRLLGEQDLISQEGRRSFWLAKPEVLLRDWSAVYSSELNQTRFFYSMLPLSEIEERLADNCERQGIRYGLALFSGADRVAPFTSYSRASAFIEGQLEVVAESLDLKPVTSGANIALLSPYDDGVFYGLRDIEGIKVVSDIQLYLDLKNTIGRGEEAAEFLLERRILPRWQQEANQITPQEQ